MIDFTLNSYLLIDIFHYCFGVLAKRICCTDLVVFGWDDKVSVYDEIGHCKLDAFHNKYFAVEQKNQNQDDFPLRVMPVLQFLLHSQMLKYQDTPDQGQFGLTSG